MKHRKINIFSFAKFHAILFTIGGLIAGIFYSFGGLIIDSLVSFGLITTQETPGLSYGTVLAFGALVGMPIVFAACGFILGLIEALLFNLFAKWLRKLSINFEK